MSGYSDEQISTAFFQLQGHVLELHGRWKLYRKLYRGNADSHPILVAVGSEMFRLLDRLLHRGVFVLIRQLTDPPRTAGRLNASFHGFLEVVAGPDYRTTHPDLVAIIEQMSGKNVIRKHVNKYIAHLDFELLAEVNTDLDALEIAEVSAAVEASGRFANEFGRRFLNELPVPHDEKSDLISTQAEALVRTLRAGLNR